MRFLIIVVIETIFLFHFIIIIFEVLYLLLQYGNVRDIYGHLIIPMSSQTLYEAKPGIIVLRKISDHIKLTIIINVLKLID